MISILSKLLILIDDREKIRKKTILEFLPEDKKSIIYSGLGRLKKRGLIDTFREGRSVVYQIAPKGKKMVYDELAWLKTIGKNKKTFLLAFSIPENKKVLREQFRTALRSIGMTIIQRGLFLGKLTGKEPMLTAASRFNLNQYIRIFEINHDSRPTLPKNDAAENLYEKFIDNTRSFLKYIQRFDKKHLRFRAKTLVFLLAQAIKTDTEDEELAKLRHKSQILYHQIRNFCYE